MDTEIMFTLHYTSSLDGYFLRNIGHQERLFKYTKVSKIWTLNLETPISLH